jgi:putative ABC transport system permease protein
MRWISRMLRRLKQWARRDLVEADVDAEMKAHIDCEIAEYMAAGISRREATRMAYRDFGGVQRYKEEARDVLGLRALDDAGRDLRFAGRLLRRSPGFTVAVVLTFALGIGCTGAIFTLVDGILIRPLPYARPSELVALWERNVPRAVDRNVVSVSMFERWRSETHSFSDVAAMVPAPHTLGGASPERISAAQVSPSYFRLLGVHPILGRDFTRNDELNGGSNVAVLSHRFWRDRYRAESSIIGQSILMDGVPYTVVGVMPPDFEPPSFGWMTEYPLWIPFAPSADNRNWGRFLHVIARVRPRTTIAQAKAELVALSARLSRDNPEYREWSATIVPLREQIIGDVRRPLLTLFGAVSLLLLMAIVNVSNLVTAFTRRRLPELLLRQAIGATRGRLFRQQLTLTLMLAVLGMAVGIAVALTATHGLLALAPPDVPRLEDARVDSTVWLFVLAVTCLTSIVMGTLSAARAVPRAGGSLDIGTTRATTRLNGARLVTCEIAVGLVLTALAMLMVRSLLNLGRVDLGFQPRDVMVGRVSLPSTRYPTDAQRRQFFDALVARVNALPGVASASIATTSPFACCSPATTVRDATHGADARAPSPTTDVRFVDTSYFAALRIPIISGRPFASVEASDGPPRALVSQALARTLWGDGNPLDHRISIDLFNTTTAVVIGVVGDVHYGDVRTPSRPAAYLSTNRFASSERDLIVRSSQGSATSYIEPIRRTLASLDSSIPLYRASSLERVVDERLAQERFVTALLSAFALLALALTAVGVHGVLSTDVALRRREIGIRVALGADRGSVYALVLRRMTAPTVLGMAIGIGGAVLLSRALSALVFGITTTDVATFGIVILTIAVVAVVATWLPAFRATRVPAVEAMKAE